MNPDIFQAVWPIEDSSRTLPELIDEATTTARPNLYQLATQAHARLIGEPEWRIKAAADVPGFLDHAPRKVLIAYVRAIAERRPSGAAA